MRFFGLFLGSLAILLSMCGISQRLLRNELPIAYVTETLALENFGMIQLGTHILLY